MSRVLSERRDGTGSDPAALVLQTGDLIHAVMRRKRPRIVRRSVSRLELRKGMYAQMRLNVLQSR